MSSSLVLIDHLRIAQSSNEGWIETEVIEETRPRRTNSSIIESLANLRQAILSGDRGSVTFEFDTDEALSEDDMDDMRFAASSWDN